MKKIDKLFIKSFIGPFILTTAIVVFIFLMRFLMMYFGDFIGKDLGIDAFSRLFFFFSLITVPTALPLATLLATLMVFGNFGEHTELTALKSAGIPLSRLIRPTLIFTVFISIASFFYNNYLNPWANLKGYSLLYDIKTAKMTLNIQEGIFYKEIPGYRIKVQKKMADGKTLKNVLVYDHTSNNGNRNVTIADSGKMFFMANNNYLVFELFNGQNYMEPQNSFNKFNETQFVRNSFKKNKIIFSLESFGIKRTNEEQFKYHEYMKNISELNKQIDSSNKEVKKVKFQNNEQIKSQSSFMFKGYTIKKDTIGRKNRQFPEILPGPWIAKKLKDFNTGYRKTEIQEYNESQINSIINMLESNYNTVASKQKEIWRADVEKWHKFTMAFSCLVMFFIGASLGSIIKKGGFGMPVIVSISFFILLYVLMQLGDKYAKEGLIPVIVGVWMPNAVLLIISIFLLNKASNDAPLFENETYSKIGKLFTQLINRRKKPNIDLA